MSAKPYKLGNAVRLICTTSRLNAAGGYDAANPTSVTCVITRAGQPPVELTGIASLAVGVCFVEYLPPAVGTYGYQFYCTGACVCAAADTFTVIPL
jgi:hypothetical protein